MMTSADDGDLVDAITSALSRVRGRRRHGMHAEHHHGRHDHAHGEHVHGVHRRGQSHDDLPDRATLQPGGAMAQPARLRMLDALAAATTPLAIGLIAEAVGVDQPRASRLVQQSIHLGLVVREADPEDARRSRVRLTDEGARVARGIRGERRESVRTALADFSDAERIEFARLLAKFAASWPAPR